MKIILRINLNIKKEKSIPEVKKMGYETVKRIAVIIGIILTILILNAFSLCFTEMMEIEDQHPLYNFFQSFESQEKYTQFWVIYWGISFFLSFF